MPSAADQSYHVAGQQAGRDGVLDVPELTSALLFQGDCWICMELMSTSLDKFYKYVYCALDNVIPEEILGKITLAVSRWSPFLLIF